MTGVMRGRRILVAIVAIAFATHIALAAAGFCFEKLRPLSDSELINLAVAQRLNRIRARDPARAEIVESALSRMEDCCAVERLTNVHAGNNVVADRVLRILTGQPVATVTLNFGPPPTGEIWDPDYVIVTACGCVLD